MTKIPGIEPG